MGVEWGWRGRFWGRYSWLWRVVGRIGVAAFGGKVLGCGDWDGTRDGDGTDLRRHLYMVKTGEVCRQWGSVIGNDNGKGQRGDFPENRKALIRLRRVARADCGGWQSFLLPIQHLSCPGDGLRGGRRRNRGVDVGHTAVRSASGPVAFRVQFRGHRTVRPLR